MFMCCSGPFCIFRGFLSTALPLTIHFGSLNLLLTASQEPSVFMVSLLQSFLAYLISLPTSSPSVLDFSFCLGWLLYLSSADKPALVLGTPRLLRRASCPHPLAFGTL